MTTTTMMAKESPKKAKKNERKKNASNMRITVAILQKGNQMKQKLTATTTTTMMKKLQHYNNKIKRNLFPCVSFVLFLLPFLYHTFNLLFSHCLSFSSIFLDFYDSRWLCVCVCGLLFFCSIFALLGPSI